MKITEPNKKSEFEVQAYVWTELCKIGINARGEVEVKFNDENRRSKCRFDIAIFDQGTLAGILEIKAGLTVHKSEHGWLGTRQGSRYSSFGVPVIIIYGQSEAEKFISITEAAGAIQW